jgi:hypothetical protein
MNVEHFAPRSHVPRLGPLAAGKPGSLAPRVLKQ